MSLQDLNQVMVFGTFDMVHQGHVNLFKQARKLVKNPFLIVSIARDKNVLKIKGHLPRKTQAERKLMVAKNPLVDKVVIGGSEDHLPHIIKERPDVIALGYDQVAYVRGLRTRLKEAGLKTLIVRLKPFKPKVYKTTLLQQKTS